MGYRSDGVLTIHKKVWTYLKGQDALGVRKLPELLSTGCDIREEDEIVIIEYACLKIYDTYPDVQEFYKLLDYLDELQAEDMGIIKDSEEVYQYIRIGEEFDDVEQQGDRCDFWVSRNLERY